MLIEAAPGDSVWGVGLGRSDLVKLAWPPAWCGANVLGWALMEVRAAIRAKSGPPLAAAAAARRWGGDDGGTGAGPEPCDHDGQDIAEGAVCEGAVALLGLRL